MAGEKPVLDAERGFARRRTPADIGAVRLENMGVDRIFQIHFQHVVPDLLFERGIFHREQHFDAAV